MQPMIVRRKKFLQETKMKLIEAIRIIEGRTKLKGRPVLILKNEKRHIRREPADQMKRIVSVHSVLLQDDLIALQTKTKEASIKEAISKAVYHYLKCHDIDEDT